MKQRNSVANTKELIGMINEDRFTEVKQHLGSVLPLMKAAELPGGGRSISCGNCGACQYSTNNDLLCHIGFKMQEPAWSNCAGCELK